MTFTIRPSDVEFYKENGYLLARGVFPASEAAALRGEAHALAERLARQGKDADATWESARGLAGEAARARLVHCHDVQFHSAAFSRLLVDPRWLDVAAALLGTDNVQLHHSKMFIKPSERGSPFPLHQDYPYFPHEKHTMMAAIFHFDDAPIDKGCVRVVPGSHRLGPLPHETKGGHHLPPERFPLESATPCEARAGDVLFFGYLTVHGSGLNVSDEARTTLLVQFRDPEDRPTEKVHLSRGQGMILRGVDLLEAPTH